MKSLIGVAPTISKVQSPHVKWWPKSLEGNLDGQKTKDDGFGFYSSTRPASKVENETLLFAIDWTNGRGYFYGR